MSSFFRRAGADIARFFQSLLDPSAETDKILVYAKDVSGVSQLFGRSDDGTVHQITPPLIGAGWLGDGSDGAAVVAVNTTLTRNMFYSSLTINPGIILNPGGFAIFCTGTITINGSIERSGNNGIAGVAGVPSSGIGGAALSSGFLFGSYAGGTGGFGGGFPGIAGGSTLNSPRGYVGSGGAGGTVTSAGGAGGTVTNEIPAGGDVRTVREMVKLRDAFGASIDCGAGGGGGGGASGGGAGGGAGSGGGVIMVAARAFAGAGVIRARGGDGKNANGGIGAGAGGGGMGGFIGIVKAQGATPTTDVAGGAGGTGSTAPPGGVPGAAGSAGLVITLTIGP